MEHFFGRALLQKSSDILHIYILIQKASLAGRGSDHSASSLLKRSPFLGFSSAHKRVFRKKELCSDQYASFSNETKQMHQNSLKGGGES